MIASRTVSIVLPTFNRAHFLDQAFDAIRRQEYFDWELILVDDGSTDETRSKVEAFATQVPQSVRYIFQENQGAYGARNTGVRHATGAFVAFYDSDDVWLAHHLAACVAALLANLDVHWVYGASEVVDLRDRRLVDANTFFHNGKPKRFLRLRHERRGQLCVISDHRTLAVHIMSGLMCGLQNSVLRRCVFEQLSFEATSRNEAEDQLFPARALSAGFQFGYLDTVHVRYHVHGGNSSATAAVSNAAKRRRVVELLVDGLERLPVEVRLDRRSRTAWRRRLSSELFWNLGYSCLWLEGRRAEANRCFTQALAIWPWSPLRWKTYLLARARMIASWRAENSASPGHG